MGFVNDLNNKGSFYRRYLYYVEEFFLLFFRGVKIIFERFKEFCSFRWINFVGRIVDVKFLVCFVDGFRLVGRGSSKNCYFGLDLD